MMFFKNLSSSSTGLLRKVTALVVTASLIVLGLMFSALLFAVILVVAVIAWCYLWWKTRELRRLMRDRQVVFERNEHEKFRGEIIEGEVIREVIEKSNDDSTRQA